MEMNQRAAEDWLDQNREALISCPFQPGNLIISKNACGKRRLASQMPLETEIRKLDLFLTTVMKGLSLCAQCPISKRLIPEPEELQQACAGFSA
jgi:hypothetical protein